VRPCDDIGWNCVCIACHIRGSETAHGAICCYDGNWVNEGFILAVVVVGEEPLAKVVGE